MCLGRGLHLRQLRSSRAHLAQAFAIIRPYPTTDSTTLVYNTPVGPLTFVEYVRSTLPPVPTQGVSAVASSPPVLVNPGGPIVSIPYQLQTVANQFVDTVVLEGTSNGNYWYVLKSPEDPRYRFHKQFPDTIVDAWLPMLPDQTTAQLLADSVQ